MESNFEKYLLCEQSFNARAKKNVISTIQGYLESFKKNATKIINDHLEHVDRVHNFDEVGKTIENEIGRLNEEYITKITEFINSRKWDR